METFELYLSPIDAKRFKAIVTKSPVGEGETETLLPFFEDETDWRTTVIKTLETTSFKPENFPQASEQELMVKSGILHKDKSAFHPNYLANIGQALYQALFPSGSRLEKALLAAERVTESNNTQLHIQLKFEADVVQRARLADYPWELLHDSEKFLLHRHVTISRYIAHETVPPNLTAVKRLNVLLVSSSAFDLDQGLKPLTKKEQQAIRKGLEKASEAELIRLAELEYATVNELRAFLTEHRGEEAPHVLHFDGHGLFGKQCPNPECSIIHKGIKTERCRKCNTALLAPQGYLVFENEEGEPDYVSAAELGTLLRQSSFGDGSNTIGGVALVVLSACQSAMAVAGDSVFNGTAQNLISHRVPAVVAMQYSVGVEAATTFAEQFYRSLGQRNSLAVAISQGREAMGIEGNQWYRPVLYLRWRDNEGGQLFSQPAAKASVHSTSIPNNLPRSGVIRFVGRKQALETLHQQLQQVERVVVITGMGGIGKTELALQYAYHHWLQGTYPGGICWLLGQNENVGTKIVEFAKARLRLEPPKDWDLKTQIDYCWQYWREGDVLVVFDDVSDYLQIKPYLPPIEQRFKVLMTTRKQWLGESFERLPLNELSESAALDLLVSFVGEKRIKREIVQAKQLCADLGFLPLGLELVGRYLQRKSDLSLAEMQQRLADRILEHRSLKEPSPDMTEDKGVSAAFDLSWQALNTQAQQMGCLLSLFALAPIPWYLVVLCLPKQDSKELEDIRDDYLVNLSLLQRKSESTYQLHQLIREFLKAKLEQSPWADNLKRKFCEAIVAEVKKMLDAPAAPTIPHIAEAATALTEWLSNEDLIWLFVGLGKFYKSQVSYAQAEILLNRALALNPNNYWTLTHRGETYKDMKRYDEALADLNRALELSPENTWILTHRGLLYRQMRCYEQALADLNRAIELSPKNIWWILTHRGETYQEMKRYDEALADLHRAIELSPDHIWILTHRNLLYQEMKRYDEALADLNRALELSPNNSWILTNRNLLYQEMKRYDEALADLNRALELSPDDTWTLTHRGLLYSQMRRYDEALADLNHAHELSPNSSWILTHRGNTYKEMGYYNEALADLHRALEFSPNDDWILTYRGLLYKEMKRYEEACTDFNSALDINQYNTLAIAERNQLCH